MTELASASPIAEGFAAGRPGTDLAAEGAQSSRRRAIEGLFFHAIVVAALIACQIAITPARVLNADNTWHFRFARDIVLGKSIYWSAVDANRLFPDLLLSMAAYILPGGDDFAVWKVSFYCLSVLAIYLSLCWLAAVLYDEASRRRMFLLTAVTALLLLMILAPFWDRWLLDPGNHGTALPACFGSLALLLWMNRAGRLHAAVILGFIAVTTLTVASNRYLLIAFLAPLLVAVLLVWAVRIGAGLRARSRPPMVAAPAGLLPALAATVGVAVLWGILGWQMIGELSWHQLVTPGGLPPFPESDYWGWLATRWDQSLAAMASSLAESYDVLAGIVLLVATIPACVVLLARADHGRFSGAAENRVILAALAAVAAVASLAFLLISITTAEPWQFRFIAVPTALAVVFFASLPVRLDGLAKGRHGALAAAALSCVVILAVTLSARRQGPAVAEEQAFRAALARLEATLVAHAGGRIPPLRGFSEYWIANDVTARSKILSVETLEPDRRMSFRFFNNNAEHLCAAGFFYILHDDRKDEPRKDQIFEKLGPPTQTEIIDLAKFQKISIFYYDSDLLQSRVVDEAKQAALRLFPDFECGPQHLRAGELHGTE